MECEAGDFVKIHTHDETIEGTLLPRPAILKGDFIVLKLENGYNIGIDKSKIKKTELLKKGTPPKNNKREIKKNLNLPKVSILSYGGTISSKIDYKTGGVYADLTAEDFVEMNPELENIANMTAKKELSMMSEDFDASIWQRIANDVAREINNGADGVVITQGTDTLHYTTAALSFFLKKLSKPVIITASQRSIDRGSSDAFLNLLCAVNAAANFDGAGVYSCMHGSSDDEHCLLIRGTKVRKMHTSRRDAFRPMNELPIAKVFPNKKIEESIEIINNNYKKKTNEKTICDNHFEKDIAMIFVHPGIDPAIIDYYLSKNIKGIVLMATALGHVPTFNEKLSFLPYLKKCKEKNVPVIIASQTLYGKVHPLVYTALRKLSIELDCIFVEDMTPEAAYVKLGWALAHAKNKEEVKTLMQKNISYEINERIDEKSFLY